ncbi:hypothetical protein ASV17_13045 [Enterobacter hormaechei subsp. xiangfangensis]|nr:hypothetical protein YA46_13035 [Enterobacter hormaechei subsp. xiangfangensis]KTH86067.1 hypothetical protein ASV17_13045 [Enterobacter hormaechei subsp. xiangfangensis]
MRYFYCDKFESMLIYVIYRIRVVIKHSGLFFLIIYLGAFILINFQFILNSFARITVVEGVIDVGIEWVTGIADEFSISLAFTL